MRALTRRSNLGLLKGICSEMKYFNASEHLTNGVGH